MVPIRLSGPGQLDAWEPKERILIACEVFERYERYPLREIWVPRTYEVYRDGLAWRIDFGAGRHEHCVSWECVVDWFGRMRPRNIEILL